MNNKPFSCPSLTGPLETIVSPPSTSSSSNCHNINSNIELLNQSDPSIDYDLSKLNSQNWRFSFPSSRSENSSLNKWKDGIILNNNKPRPQKVTKIEELVKGKLKEKIGRLLNNEEMQKQGKAIEKGATTYENNILKTQKRLRKHINSSNVHTLNNSKNNNSKVFNLILMNHNTSIRI
eukprot:gene4132-5171_t